MEDDKKVQKTIAPPPPGRVGLDEQGKAFVETKDEEE